MFINLADSVQINNSPRMVFNMDRDFTLSSKLKVDFNEIYDGGALILFCNETLWAKLFFE